MRDRDYPGRMWREETTSSRRAYTTVITSIFLALDRILKEQSTSFGKPSRSTFAPLTICSFSPARYSLLARSETCLRSETHPEPASTLMVGAEPRGQAQREARRNALLSPRAKASPAIAIAIAAQLRRRRCQQTDITPSLLPMAQITVLKARQDLLLPPPQRALRLRETGKRGLRLRLSAPVRVVLPVQGLEEILEAPMTADQDDAGVRAAQAVYRARGVQAPERERRAGRVASRASRRRTYRSAGKLV